MCDTGLLPGPYPETVFRRSDERSDKERPPLQGKVILEPALTAAEKGGRRHRPSGWKRRASSSSMSWKSSPRWRALVIKPRRRHRLLAWGAGAVGVLSLGQYGAFALRSISHHPALGRRLAGGLGAGCGGHRRRGGARVAAAAHSSGARMCARGPKICWPIRGRPGPGLCEGLAERSGDKGAKGIRPGWPSSTRATAIGKC